MRTNFLSERRSGASLPWISCRGRLTICLHYSTDNERCCAGGINAAAIAAFFIFIVLLMATACGDGASVEEQSSAAEASETATSAAISEPATTARPKRIILISLDTVGARNVGGYSDAKTPNLDKIARDGVRFDRFYSASTYTLPSHMSMLTGLDVIEHGVVNLPSRLAPDVPTLATELGKAGYKMKALVIQRRRKPKRCWLATSSIG
jgi:hypothetical protein